jgi:hypothetical protein
MGLRDFSPQPPIDWTEFEKNLASANEDDQDDLEPAWFGGTTDESGEVYGG